MSYHTTARFQLFLILLKIIPNSFAVVTSSVDSELNSYLEASDTFCTLLAVTLIIFLGDR